MDVHIGSPEHVAEAQGVNTPSQVTPCPSIEEQLVPEQDTVVPTPHEAVQVPNWETALGSSASGPASVTSSGLVPPHPAKESPMNAAITTSARFIRKTPSG